MNSSGQLAVASLKAFKVGEGLWVVFLHQELHGGCTSDHAGGGWHRYCNILCSMSSAGVNLPVNWGDDPEQ